MAGAWRTRPTEPGDPSVLRYVYMENSEAGSSKFYTVVVEQVDGPPVRYRCRVEWGKIGAQNVQEQVKLETPDRLKADGELINWKLAKQGRGYVVVREQDNARAPAATRDPNRRGFGDENLAEALAERKRSATWAL